jgi:hypothetical protein
MAQASPYEVPVKSVVRFEPAVNAPLAPFEQRQLQNLLQQVEAAPDRVREAFFRQIAS